LKTRAKTTSIKRRKGREYRRRRKRKRERKKKKKTCWAGEKISWIEARVILN